MKSILGCLKNSKKLRCLSHRLSRAQSYTTRVPNRAVNRLRMTPRLKVTAKPLMGPVPKRNSAQAVISVVTWESIMVQKALS